MKKFILFSLFALVTIISYAKPIVAVRDSGKLLYVTTATTSDTPALAHIRTYWVDKSGAQVYTANGILHLTDANNKEVLTVNISNSSPYDSFTVNGAKPASITAAASKLVNIIGAGYFTYELHKTGTATTYRTVKSGRGKCGGFSIDSIGVGTGGNLATISVYDGTDSTGTLIGTWSTATAQTIAVPNGFTFNRGLTVKPRGTTVGRFTFFYYLVEPDEFNAIVNPLKYY